MSGEELIEAARKFEKNLLNFFWRQGVSTFESEDLVQETYLRLWKYRAEYKPTAKLSTFLFILARQVRLDALRRETRRETREKSWGEDLENPGPANACAADDARWALSRLTPPLRDAVELAVMQDMPYAEVAKILGIPVGTVKSRVSNALKKMKELFDER
jgi:RNA polymerase sigma-70 factor (ECF subfamily)